MLNGVVHIVTTVSYTAIRTYIFTACFSKLYILTSLRIRKAGEVFCVSLTPPPLVYYTHPPHSAQYTSALPLTILNQQDVSHGILGRVTRRHISAASRYTCSRSSKGERWVKNIDRKSIRH
jgi:hypothetical protein